MHRHRLVALVVALAVVAAPLVGVTAVGPAPAQAATAAVPTEPEAPDFASEVYGDPWDYNNAADQNTDQTGTGTTTISDGALHMTLQPGDSMSMVDTVAGSLPYGRDGAAKSIDTSRYTGLSFEMDQPLSGHIGAIYWFTCRERTAACTGGITFPVVTGDHVYDFDLRQQSTLLGKVPWSSAKVVALRLDPVVLASGSGNTGRTASITWMRLHAPADAAHPHAALPPGNHGTYQIDPLPEPVVDTPNPTQGTDLATAQRGRPWEFTSSTNAAGVTTSNATVLAYDSRGMTGRNAGPAQNDPQVHLPVSAFSADTFRYLTVDMTYDGAFSLSGSSGGGKLARLIWNTSTTGTPQIGNDMLTFSGANAQPIAIDLTAQSDLDEDAIAPKLGWAGQTITGLRFDPNEDPGAATWHLQGVHLRATPAATESTTITFHDAAWVSGTTATVRVGTGAASSFTTIASGIAVTKGSNAVQFSLGSLPAGTYRAEVILRHPSGTAALAYSSAPVVMTHDPARDPRGSFDSADGTTAGVTLRGWAWDPDATAGTQVRLYDQTGAATSIGTVTTSIARPDVQKAYSAAPAATGWQTSVRLSAGTHTICAYGLNVGAGSQNTTLGCRSVTVREDTSHDPQGRLDGLTAGTGTATATGWAFDPDGAPISVRFYEGGTSLGTVQTTVARPDVQKVYPTAPATSGYTATLRLSAGTHTVCAYGLNTGAGTTNTTLGCRSVTVR